MSTIAPHPENSAGFRLAVIVESTSGLAALGLAKLFGVPLGEQFATGQNRLMYGVLFGIVATVPMLAMLWAMLESRWHPLVELKDQVRQLVRELFPRTSMVQLALIALLAGAGEELLFRGVLQTAVGRWTTPLAGLAVASLIFGALHAMSWLYFLLATLIGIYLGWLLITFNDLTVPMVTHGLYDFVALLFLIRIRDSEPPR